MRSRSLSYRLLLATLVLFCSLFTQQKAYACHAGAADMWVTYVGPGIDGCTGTTSYDYIVTVKVYEPCQTCDLDITGSTSFTIQCPSLPSYGVQPFTLTDLNGPSSPPDTVSSICPAFNDSNSCKHITGVRNYYTDRFPASRFRTLQSAVITLPSAQFDWTFTYEILGAGRITTVNMPTCSGVLDIHVILNNVTKYNNSSPRFTSNPMPFLCYNQPATYLNSPYDPNGDSLMVYLQAPYNSATTQCAFPDPSPLVAPYISPTDPIGSAASNPFTLNNYTGAATFTPASLGVGPYILAFRCEDYEKGSGIMLSRVDRDVQISILPCASPPPSIDSLKPTIAVFEGKVVPLKGTAGGGNAATAGNAIVTCPGNNMKFTLTSQGQKDHKLYMYSNHDQVNMTGATFSVSGTGTESISGTLSWTPAVSDIGERTVTITSADSTCTVGQAIVLYSYTVIFIKVIPGLDAGKDLLTCQLNPPRRQLYVKGFGNLDLKLKWTDISGGPALGIDNDTIATPTVQAPGGTQYVVYSPDLSGQCKTRDTVLLYNDTSNTVDIFPQTDRFVMCRPGYLQLDAVTTGGGPVDNITSIGKTCDTLPVFTCPTPDSITIFGSVAFGTDASYDSIGTSATIFNGDVLSERFQFLITKDELKEYGLRSGTIKSLSFLMKGNTTNPAFEYANFTIYIKCTDSAELNKANGFQGGMIQVYQSTANLTFSDGWQNFVFDKPYNWDTSRNIIIGICYSNNPATLGPCTPGSGFPGVITYAPTTYVSTLDLKAPDATTTDICNGNTIADIKARTARPVFGMTFCDMPGKPFIFTWASPDGGATPGGGFQGHMLSDTTIKAPLAYVPKTTIYKVTSFGKNGCKIGDSLQVYVPVHNYSVWPADTSICYGMTAPLEVRNGVYYQWFEYEEGKYLSANNSLSCEYCANPTAHPLKSTHYKIMVGDDVFCYDTIDAYIEVRPLPQVHILTNDTVVRYGQSVQLLVNGAKLYNWTPVSSLNNPNISYPVATPTEPTTYVVSGITSTGCYSYDTVRVGINYRDNLQIPTAFTPNGDGKNDLFHITNMTFQRFVEFRVFNRWGQQVYEGLDPKRGWDGTWKGVPQEMGDYTYIIRVGYPDGLVETYKGSVTLIR